MIEATHRVRCIVLRKLVTTELTLSGTRPIILPQCIPTVRVRYASIKMTLIESRRPMNLVRMQLSQALFEVVLNLAADRLNELHLPYEPHRDLLERPGLRREQRETIL